MSQLLDIQAGGTREIMGNTYIKNIYTYFTFIQVHCFRYKCKWCQFTFTEYM